MSRFPLVFVFALLAWPASAAAQAGAAEPPAGTEPAPQPGAQPPAEPSGAPPEHYYVEPPDPNAQPAPAPAQRQGPPPQVIHEPPPPGYGYGPQLVWEPPPPPKPRHVAPKYSLWAGARLAWFIPFGNLWATCTVVTTDGFCVQLEGTAWSDYASSGPAFEVDAGARLGRNYNLFLLWERAALGAGGADAVSGAAQQGGDTDFWALGLRVSSNPDKVGFLTEVAIGYRRFRAVWDDGTELRLTNAPFEARIGLGADIRMSRLFSLSPLLTLGVGSFADAEWLNPDGTTQAATGPLDARAGHGWITLGIGGHMDIAGSE
jgi:hypothetical protein